MRVSEALCDSAAAMRAGEHDAARAIFYARAHSGLHVIADELTDVDRPQAAELLRTKNAVEQAFDSSGDKATAPVDELGRVLQMALESLGAPSSPCP